MRVTPFKGAVRLMAAMAVFAAAACTPAPAPPFPESAGFTRIKQTGGDLVTLGWLTIVPPGQELQPPLLVVVEGDGAAWSPDGTPPQDPTPRSGTGARLSLALAENRALLYLARPCQYLSSDQRNQCSVHLWTDKRFSMQAVSALNRLIDKAKMTAGLTDRIRTGKIIMVGFSGGGLLAAELALMRQDVAGLITVAAPLDLAAWTRLHRISALETVRPAEELLCRLFQADFPQRHLYGSRDRIVPLVLAEETARRLPAGSVRYVKSMGHDDNWLPAVTDALAGLENQNGATH